MLAGEVAVVPKPLERSSSEIGTLVAELCALGALGFLWVGCQECAKGVAILPVWGLPLAALGTAASLAFGLAALGGAERWRTAQRIVLTLLLIPLPLVLAAGAIVGAAPCPACLVFWGGTVVAAALALGPVRGGPIFLALVGIATVLMVRLSGGANRATFTAGLVQNGLQSLGFYREASPALQAGIELPLPESARYAVFATRCAVCTAHVAGARLQKSRVPVESVVLIAPDADPKWVAPFGYERSPWVRDGAIWDRARLDPQGPPALYRVEAGCVVEAMR